ncbi:MAG TPA: hypothetical protein VML55_18780 [Planctomycetaceae bacterium]|nr:hypothetical protein [Planctomycetaceae bacterium]
MEDTGHGTISRRIARRTTDLLAISLVLVAGLGLGRQIVSWWRSEPAPAGAAADVTASSPWNAQGVPLTLEFGDLPFAVERTPVTGTRETVAERLAEACAVRADSTDAPAIAVNPAEQRLLDALAGLEPVRQRAGRWQVHLVDGPVLISVASRDANNAVPDPNGPASAPRRVVCWGLAFPTDNDQWTLYTFRPVEAPARASAGEAAACLPPGSRRILSARAADGGSLTAFEGTGTLETWKQSMETCLNQAGYHAIGESRLPSSGWNARFASSDGRSTVIDVHVFRSTAGTLSGMITTTRQNPLSR